MSPKNQFREYFIFSRKDRIAVFVLLLLIGLAAALPYMFKPATSPLSEQDSAWIRAVDQTLKPVDGEPYPNTGGQAYDTHKKSGNTFNNARSAKQFNFDPNTLDFEGWRDLGLRDRTIETILKYRSKGGRFRRPADLEKIFGLPPEIRERIQPFVRIGEGIGTGSDAGTGGRSETRAGNGNGTEWSSGDGRGSLRDRNFPSGQGFRTEAGPRPDGRPPEGKYQASDRFQTADGQKTEGKFQSTGGFKPGGRKKYVVVDLNKTDTTQLIALPCIGSRLAQRILQFRDKLGGFHSVEQVREIYGITDSSFAVILPYLKTDPADCRLMNLNTVSLDELKNHPYFRYELARTIIAYRQEHGNFSDMADLKKLIVITPEIFLKIRPYLKI
ncbi:MAG: helix-hairpin-helix domain-containing protein [Chitinophagaceae bacterium]